jgi:hypothetical protein
MSAIVLNSKPDEASFLLENLYQLVLKGSTDCQEFELLDAEVYGRLHTAYPVDTLPARNTRELEIA